VNCSFKKFPIEKKKGFSKHH